MKTSYTPEAIDDLKRLRAFIAKHDPIAAQRIAIELLNGIEKLKVFPQMGLQVIKAPQPKLIRDLFIGSYTVRYLITQEQIVILRLWQGKEARKEK